MFSLEGCRAKIGRAKKHSAALEVLRAETLGDEADRPTIGGKFDDQTGHYVLYISRCPDYTDFLVQSSLIVGDAIHNLRGALDHLVFQLAFWNTAGKVKNESVTQFPICDTPAEFSDQARRRLAELHPNQVAVIERFQTYNPVSQELGLGFTHPLLVIRELSNADKHRLLNVIVIPTSVMILQLPFDLSVNEGFTRLDLPKTAILGANLWRYKLPSGMKPPDIDVVGHLPGQIALPDFPPPYPIGFALPQFLIRTVEKIIDLFEPLT